MARAGPILYQVTDLSTLLESAPFPSPGLGGDYYAQARAINSSGQVLMNVECTSNCGTNVEGNYAYLLSDGALMSRGNFFATGLSDSGLIVGSYIQAGTAEPIGIIPNETFPGEYLDVEPKGINDSGWVVGSSGGDGIPLQPLFWNIYSQVSISLPGSGFGQSGYAFAINNNNQVLGVSSSIGYYFWQAGTATPLAGITPCGLSSNGLVAGTVDVNGNSVAAILDDGTITVIGTLPGDSSSSTCYVNSSDEVVGDSGSASTFLRSNGIMVNLNSVIDPALGLSFDEVAGINDAGQILADATNGQDYLLTPVSSSVPEPSSFRLFLGVCAFLLLRCLTTVSGIRVRTYPW